QRGAALAPKQVCVVGVRSFEREEAALLAALGVRVYPIAEIERRGLARVLPRALERRPGGTAAYGLTPPLRAGAPEAPRGVPPPGPGGPRPAALVPALAELTRAAAPVAVEIAEYEPHRDRDGMTARLIEELAAAMLGGDATRSMIELGSRYSAANY